MDIRDSRGEELISNIMAKKKSAIEKDSRVTVAKNKQEAKEAEIAAQQEIDLKQKAADEVVGLRAEEAMQLASVTAQTSLAKEIGDNKGYQQYLVEIRKVEATEKVGLAQAENMSGANIKVIANAGDVAGGVSSALDVLTPKGGASIAGAIEALAATEAGKALLDKFGVKLG